VRALIQEHGVTRRRKFVSLDVGHVFKNLRKFGFKALLENANKKKYPDVKACYRAGRPSIVLVICDFKSAVSLPKVVGQLDTAVDILNAEKLCEARGQLIAAQGIAHDQSCRKIILCYKEDGPFWLIDLYRQAGFEFMTPDELIAMIESQSQSGGQSA
jgi:hypothetical protein